MPRNADECTTRIDSNGRRSHVVLKQVTFKSNNTGFKTARRGCDTGTQRPRLPTYTSAVRFLTTPECAAWAQARGYVVSAPPQAAAQQVPHLSVPLPLQPSYLAFARAISECLEPRSSCLLWIVEHGIWPSSENWHLYYRVRQSYGDQRLLHEAPGHLFLDYEQADLVTFLQLAFANGWGAEILPQLTYGGAGTARAFLSHDEFVVLAHRDEAVVEVWRTTFENDERRVDTAPRGLTSS